MNELAIAILVFLVVSTLYGYYRGLIKIVLSLCSLVLTIILVAIVTPYITDYLMTRTEVYTSIKEKATEVFAEDNAKLDNTITSNQIQTIESYAVPNVLKNALIENNNSEVYKVLAVNFFEEYIGGYIAKTMVKILAFVATFIMVTIFIRLAMFSLNIFSKLPVIRGINRYGGLVAGFAQGIIIVWIFFLVATLSYTSNFGQKTLVYIAESPFLTFLFNKNFLIEYLIGL